MGAHQPPLWRVILAGLIGNVMEWYDFALYGYFVGIFSDQFFPSSEANASLIAAFGAFAAGFLVRPLGGVVLGRIGDRVGRRQALTLSVMAMALATVSMAILPTYQQVGLWAPIALVLLRILQGLSAGGEYTTSIVFLAEHAPANRRGLVTIWGLWGSVLGMLLGSAAGTLLTSNLSAAQMHSWGWRFPLPRGCWWPSRVWLASRLHGETPAATAARPPAGLSSPPRRSAAGSAAQCRQQRRLLHGLRLRDHPHPKRSRAERKRCLALNTRVMGLLLIFYPIAAWISDRLGRRPLLITGSLFLLLAGLPIFELLHSGNPTWITRGEVLLMLAVALLAGAKNPANVELMPQAVRCTGLALAFNVAEGYFGGTTPLIASWLVSSSGNPLLPGCWVALAGAITLITALWFTPESCRLPLQRL